MLWFLTLNSTFHVLNRAAYPYKLSRLISFDLISPWIRFFVLLQNSFINGDMSPYTIGIFRQTNFSQEAIRLTAGAGGPNTGVKHIQMLKVVNVMVRNKFFKLDTLLKIFITVLINLV